MSQEITKYLKLPFQFDEHKLVHDLKITAQKNWIPHFNTNGYEGEWNSIALYAKGGNETNILALDHENKGPLLPTPIMKECKYFQEVLNHFKCELTSVRLLKLKVGAAIKPHRDFELGYEDNNFRLHIPIVTNDKVDFILDGERLEMRPGECWYTNVNYVHAVANNGEIDRIHLVFDGVRNNWSDELFFSLAPTESFFPKKEESYDKATLEKIIAELELMEGEGAQNLIKDFKEKLKSIEY